MNTFLKVEDKIQRLSKGEIEVRYKKAYISFIIIIISIPFLWFSGREYNYDSLLMLFLGMAAAIFLGIGIYKALSGNRHFVIKESGKVIKPIRYNLDNGFYDEIMNIIHNDDLDEILKFKSNQDSPLCVEVWEHPDHKYIYFQIFSYKDGGMNPVSLVHVKNK
ncbi:MAG: hypothetical protein Q4F97_06665 [Bacteroidales bacterium]|nr:hypothetical protein [Bacteroidales bacterium]